MRNKHETHYNDEEPNEEREREFQSLCKYGPRSGIWNRESGSTSYSFKFQIICKFEVMTSISDTLSYSRVT